MSTSVDVSLSGDVGVDLSGIPSNFGIDIKNIPRISIGLDPITIESITVNPLDVSVRIKEIPSIRAHIPANFAVGLSLLGYDIACLRLCGEAQVITEPYVPNPCEHCGQVHDRPVPVPTPGPVRRVEEAGGGS